MGFKEYQLRLEAFRIRQAERERQLALQAWLNQDVQAVKGSSKHPKRKYTKFDEFYDFQARTDEIREEFEVGYQKSSKKKEDVGMIMAKRIKKFKQYKKAGKVIPWKERRSSYARKL